MGKDTKIEWAHHTFNPWWGCVKVSPACDHCYAETFSRRVGYSEKGSEFPIWGKDTERRVFGEKHWNEPLRWNREAEKSGVRARVFCGSMCDVMEDHPRAEQQRPLLYDLIERTESIDWLLLTKRPQNFRRFLPSGWLKEPLPNVWLMTTVESSEYLWRVTELLKTPAAVRGLSVEPLLGPLNLEAFLEGHEESGVDVTRSAGSRVGGCVGWTPPLDWVIVGGESGPGARPMHPEWARGLRDQCQAAGVAFHFKQWGEYYPLTRTDGVHKSPFGGQKMMHIGKQAAGRLLDGREWNEVPA